MCYSTEKIETRFNRQKAAFLQGENIDRELYVLPTKEANTDKIWILKKCTSGLVDTSRQWYNNTVKQVLSLVLKCQKEIHRYFIVKIITNKKA